MRYSLIVLGLGIYLLFSSGSVVPTAPAQIYPELKAAPEASYSYNWAGYAAEGDDYTQVSGTWVVPAVSKDAWGADATWVGIGGIESDDLIQAGTQAIVGPDGGVEYQAWFERMPEASIPLPLAVRPGDTVSVSIEEISSGTWKVALSNKTTGKQYSLSVRYDSSRSSAEWVEEAPSTEMGGIIPLSNFGTTRFLGGSATVNGHSESIALAGGEPMHMIARHGGPLAITSVLDEDGGFTVTRTDESPRVRTTFRELFRELPRR